MNTRLSFSKRAWLLSAATALLLSPTMDTMAQEASKKSSKNPTLKSAVQRELEAIYARNGLEAPKLTTKDAVKRLESVNGKSDVKLVKKPEAESAKKSTKAAAKKPSTFWSRLTLKSDSSKKSADLRSTDSKKTDAKKSTSSSKRVATIRGGRSARRTTSSKSTASKSTATKSVAKKSILPTFIRPASKTEVVEPKAAKKEKNPNARNPKNFFTRIFPWSKKLDTKTASKKPAATTPLKSLKPKILPDRLKSQATKSAKPIVEVAEPKTETKQVADAKTIWLPVPEPLAETESKPISKAEVTVVENVNDPFTDVTESEADGTSGTTDVVLTEDELGAKKPEVAVKEEPALEEIPFAATETKEATKSEEENPFSGKKLDEDAFLPPQKTEPKVAETKPEPKAEPKKEASNPFAAIEKEAKKNAEAAKPAAKVEEKKAVVESKPIIKPKAAPEFKEPAAEQKSELPKITAKKAEPKKTVAKKPAGKHQEKMARIAQRADQVGLKGFCPVTLRDGRDLKDGDPKFKSNYESRVYTFASADAKATFDKNPAIYAPVLGGIDVTVLTQKGQRIDGSLDHAVWYKDRLYLFSSRRTMEDFVLAPADLAKK
ncbi:MAG: hypothetical protein CMJ78_05540 [Planctomycetaceae bacterium]|nr:hypothetical protein [Planctomycetaceae bacterium]